MTAPDATRYFIIIITLICVLFDVFQRVVNGSNATISVVLNEDAHRHPIIAGAAFFLVAHIFWGIYD